MRRTVWRWLAAAALALAAAAGAAGQGGAGSVLEASWDDYRPYQEGLARAYRKRGEAPASPWPWARRATCTWRP
jgi:hypothetical protein